MGLEAWPADKSPSEGYLTAVVDGRTARFGADVMNSCATTLNVAMRLLWPERFPSTSARSLLRAFEEGGMCWPQAEGPRVVLWEKLERFAALTHTVGNFAIIPWREGNALNKAKNRTLQDCLAGVGSPRDYEDLFLMRLQSSERESGNAWWHWTEFCPVSFGRYVALANLEFYCVDDAAVRAFLEGRGKRRARRCAARLRRPARTCARRNGKRTAAVGCGRSGRGIPAASLFPAAWTRWNRSLMPSASASRRVAACCARWIRARKEQPA